MRAALESVGRNLRCFQGGKRLGLPKHSYQDELGVLDSLHARIGEPCIGWSELRSRLGELTPSNSREVLAHRDLHDGQFIWSQQGIALLDFDLLCAADSSLDVANLCAHLELRSLQTPQSFDERSKRCARVALLAGYSSFEGADFEKRLAFHEATTFLRLALLYSLRPRWRALVPSLMGSAERSISRLAS